MPVEVQPLLYTTRAEMESRLSQDGVDLRLDDNDDGTISAAEELRLVEDAWNATDYLNGTLLQFHTAAVLETSHWVRNEATYLACHFLGTRRGNLTLYCDEKKRLDERLSAIMSGAWFIPRLPRIANFQPIRANVILDRNYTKRKARVDQATETGGPVPSSHVDYFSANRWYW